MIEAHLERIDAKLDGLVAGLAKLEAGQAKLETGLEEVRAGQISMGHQMRALYEDSLDRITALDPRPEIQTLGREVADAHAGVIQRLDVFEVAVRELWRRQAPQ